MRILDRYIFSEAAVNFGINLLIFTGMLLTLRMLRFASLIINKGVEASQIAGIFLAIIPTFLEIALPLSALLGVLLAFARLSGDSEIVVMRASGLSLSQLAWPTALFGAFTFLLSLYVSLELRPWGYREVSKKLFEMARSKSTAGLSAGVFNKLGQLTLYAEEIDHQSGVMTHVIIDDKREPENRKIIFAQGGHIVSDAEAETITMILKDGSIHEPIEDRYSLTRFKTNSLVMHADEVYDPEVKAKRQRARELAFSNLRARRADLKEIEARLDNEDDSDEEDLAKKLGLPPAPDKKEITKQLRLIAIEEQRRYAMPFASILLALIGLPLGIQSPRTQRMWGAGLTVGLGLFTFLLYYGTLSVGIALSENGTLPAWIAIWIPNILAAYVAWYLIRQMGTERWQTVSEGFESVSGKVIEWVRSWRTQT